VPRHSLAVCRLSTYNPESFAGLVFSLSVNPRFGRRLRVPMPARETRRIERVLATSRVFLATCFLAALYLDTGQPGHRVLLAYELIALYLVHGVIVMWLVRFRQQPTRRFRVMVHAGDIIWPGVISLFTAGPNSPWFLFFVFVLVAAAYRWALWETLATAFASIAVLTVEVILASRWPGMLFRVRVTTDPNELIVGSAYLVVMGVLLGYLAQHDKRLQAERATVARIVGGARVDLGLTGTLQQMLGEVLQLFGATQAVLAVEETHSHFFVCQAELADAGEVAIRWLETAAENRETFLFRTPADAFYARRLRGSRGRRVLALDEKGSRTALAPSLLDGLSSHRAFNSVCAVSLSSAGEWSGRLFLLDPARLAAGDLRFLQELARQASPAVSNVYLLRRLRQRAGAVERARVARELHDGAIQSLIAVEMQVDVLRKQSGAQPARLESEMGRIQKLLREEVLKLRDLMQKTKPLAVDGNNLVEFLHDAVNKFSRETGIAANFVADTQVVSLQPRVCREVARIAQEALVNVRKHSSARAVVVNLGHNNNSWTMSVEDDGCGFGFEGQLANEELMSGSQGPAVIKERVKTINGELRIDSAPGRGSRLEIRVPLAAKAAVYG
jgi:signal transduction histidine kinase